MFLDNLPQVSTESLAKLDTAVPEVGQDLLAVLNDSVAGGHLPVSCHRTVLTLLPKKGDLSDIKSWRPVSLLCSDNKIVSKVLSKRLSKVMEQVIHSDQTYCVPSRSIVNNVSLICDVIHISKLLGLDVGLISLDQDFDRV